LDDPDIASRNADDEPIAEEQLEKFVQSFPIEDVSTR
jgi:hypothetical protein